ncbi:MAG: thermonuclease family protein [bacterium]|nr:thermonuclease family protein [bacterium]
MSDDAKKVTAEDRRAWKTWRCPPGWWRAARASAAIVASCALVAACGGGGGNVPTDVGESSPMDEPLRPTVRVIDADTVDIDGTRWRLHGIDAPETDQTCRAWGRTWACGQAATEALESRAAGMSCAGSETDVYGRTIGVCSSGGEDLNAWLVDQGWALAYRRYAEDYVGQEEEARTERRGIHLGEFVEPWNWRRGGRLEGEDTFISIASGELDVGALADRMLRGDDAHVYGRWLDDSVFAVVNDTVTVSFGASPGTTPTRIGGGVWQGAIVAIDTRTGERISGEAVIDIDDFEIPAVDIAFSAIKDVHGDARDDLGWENIPVDEGAFQARGAAGSIEGRFYGSDHGDVGGIFERDNLLGAFGGSR